MVIGCLYIPSECRNRGIASAMIEELIRFCKECEYNRVEAAVDLGPPDHKMFSSISFFPFRKFGFIVDEASFGGEFESETRMCFCNL